ncbi:M48 family metalloprotease [Staphylococcus pettenkoferi]|uniref:M48 family metalloprotease n=1 Tax=Staphylococcus pettenkoferi TaxID=170573 RepID=UPI003D6F0BDB
MIRYFLITKQRYSYYYFRCAIRHCLSFRFSGAFRYRRHIELKCDTYGSKYVGKEDINNAFQQLAKLEPINNKKRGALSSHPSLNERLRNLGIASEDERKN